MQVYSMIFKRVWRAMKEEFKKRYLLNGKFLPGTSTFGPGNDFIRAEDYRMAPDQVAPVANPRMSSVGMRLNQAVAIKQSSMMTPGYDRLEVEKQFLRAMEVEGIDRIFPGPDKVPPLPNPRLQVEEAKMKGKQMEIQAKQQEWANKLMEERRVNLAKVAQLEAQAIKLMAEAKSVSNEAELRRIEVQIQGFDAVIQAHKNYGDMVNDRIKALTEGVGGEQPGQQQAPNTGGVRGANGQSGGPGPQGVPSQMPMAPDESMGGGLVQ
jgi:hypothetical protein